MSGATRAGLARLAAAAAVAVAPPLVWHALIVAQGASALVVALGWLGTAACVTVAARLAGAGVHVAMAGAALVAVLWFASRSSAFGVYVAPIATWVMLFVLFARTLRAGREPVVSAIARICHDGRLDAAMARYTRGVTLAWSVFFAAMAGMLAAAALVLPLPAWSFIANVASWPLVAVMFAAEYAVRVRRFPAFAHVSPIAMAARLGRAGWRFAGAGK